MRIMLLLLFINIASFKIYAHDPREAFFRIEQKDSLVEIHAEFPWTIRNSLLSFKPELANASDKESFENAFFDFAKSTILLKSSSGHLFELTKVNEIENMGHSHQNNFIFIFQGNNLAEFRNEIMFNISNQQTNYHSIELQGVKTQFLTTSQNPKFNIKVIKNNSNKYWIIFLLVLTIIYLFVRKRMNTTANN